MILFSSSVNLFGLFSSFDSIIMPPGVGFIFSSLGTGEILLVLLAALLLFGAEGLPSLARTIGKAWNEMQRSANELVSAIKDSVFSSSDHSISEKNARQAAEEKKERTG
jgi:sec-independent protein translocase protein TatA